VSAASFQIEDKSRVYLSNAARGSGNDWKQESAQVLMLNLETSQPSQLDGPALTMIAILDYC
jgi:hypothetical protein